MEKMDDNKRFPIINEEEVESILDNKLTNRSKNVIKWAVSIFHDYAKIRDLNILQMTSIELNIFLKKFYVEVRMKNGDYYSKNGIMNLRYGIQKQFLKIMNVDIVNDPICKTANSTWAAVLVKLKRNSNHIPAATPNEFFFTNCLVTNYN